LVGHSLGGLLLRLALLEVPELRVRQLVMLGTPNRPPRLAAMAQRWLLFRRLTRDCGRLLASPEAIVRLPILTAPYTLIAGTAGPLGKWSPFGSEPNDGVVAVSEVPIRDTDRPQLFPLWHTVMMNHPLVHRAVVAAMISASPPPASHP
jgi:pimeloyl-ACP methyl ester carboxylesterase